MTTYRTLFRFEIFINETLVEEILVACDMGNGTWLLGVDYLSNGRAQLLDVLNFIEVIVDFFAMSEGDFLEKLKTINGIHEGDYCYLREDSIDKFVELMEPYIVMRRLME